MSRPRYVLNFQSLPVELIADIMGELDLATLIICSQLSTRMRQVISDPSLNPWRTPLSRILEAEVYPPELATLAVRQIVPRVNWIEILSLAWPHFILFTTTLPNLRELEWKEAFERRFLPGWTKWKKEFKWKEAFLKYVLSMLFVNRLFMVVQNSNTRLPSAPFLLHRRRGVDKVCGSILLKLFIDIMLDTSF